MNFSDGEHLIVNTLGSAHQTINSAADTRLGIIDRSITQLQSIGRNASLKTSVDQYFPFTTLPVVGSSRLTL
jgi:hypothetical protein